MGYDCKIVADSINGVGCRLTTLEISYPRIVHAEFMTHRVKSRNAGSNRAIPVIKLISAVTDDPFIPLSWGKNQKGMQMGEEFSPEETERFNTLWLRARNYSVAVAKRLMDAGVHKSLPNRLLEPWQYIKVIVSATEWANFFNLRIDDDAEQHIRRIADMIYECQYYSQPLYVAPGKWHIPMLRDGDQEDIKRYVIAAGEMPEPLTLEQYTLMVSAGRCARVSYLTHNGVRDIAEDIRLCTDLVTSGHWSPLEHQARARSDSEWSANFRGWKQYRKLFVSENRDTYYKELEGRKYTTYQHSLSS